MTAHIVESWRLKEQRYTFTGSYNPQTQQASLLARPVAQRPVEVYDFSAPQDESQDEEALMPEATR